MIKKFVSAAAIAASLLSMPFVAAPADAGGFRLGVLDCSIDGGHGYLIASHKGVTCAFRPSHGGPVERYTGVISKLGVDLGRTHQGELVWAVLAASRHRDPGFLQGKYYGASAEATVVTGGGVNLLVGGFHGAITLQPLSVQAQTGLNIAAAVTAMELQHPLK
jgi:hypothetical protein